MQNIFCEIIKWGYNRAMKSTRQQVLDFLASKTSATAAELSESLLVSSADVRYHLTTLRREGLVETVKEENHSETASKEGQKRKVGRPPQRYRLARNAGEDPLNHLVDALLKELLEEAPSHLKMVILGRIANRLAGEVKTEGSLAKRLVQAVARLNELNYQARWEARPGDPQVSFGTCPYSAILPAHPELCQMDGMLLEALSGAHAQQTARLVPDPAGGKYCRFVIVRESH
jgi:predicted ArsR family transcriptional regulator